MQDHTLIDAARMLPSRECRQQPGAEFSALLTLFIFASSFYAALFILLAAFFLTFHFARFQPDAFTLGIQRAERIQRVGQAIPSGDLAPAHGIVAADVRFAHLLAHG